MKKVSTSLLLLSLGLLVAQPVQAADFSVCSYLYASLGALSYALRNRGADFVEYKLKKDPDTYKVTDESLIGLIRQEAEKRGLDFEKFVVVKNLGSMVGAGKFSEDKKYVFTVGSEEFLKVFSELDAGGQKAIVQHELNHVLYNHAVKQFGVSWMSNYVGFLACYAGMSLAANYIEKNSAKDNSIASWVRTARPFASVGFGFYFGRKVSPVYSRYCEKQADLAIDDDPAVINGLIKSFQAYHDQKVNKFGLEFVQQHPEEVFGKNHPHPFERIAYLKEKLKRCSGEEA